jgi:hypothetical protein
MAAAAAASHVVERGLSSWQEQRWRKLNEEFLYKFFIKNAIAQLFPEYEVNPTNLNLFAAQP